MGFRIFRKNADAEFSLENFFFTIRDAGRENDFAHRGDNRF